jgi:hypothetical protein
MAKEAWVKDAGVWRQAKEIHVRDAGAWKPVKEGYVKDAGAWKQFFASGAGPLVHTYHEQRFSSNNSTFYTHNNVQIGPNTVDRYLLFAVSGGSTNHLHQTDSVLLNDAYVMSLLGQFKDPGDVAQNNVSFWGMYTNGFISGTTCKVQLLFSGTQTRSFMTSSTVVGSETITLHDNNFGVNANPLVAGVAGGLIIGMSSVNGSGDDRFTWPGGTTYYDRNANANNANWYGQYEETAAAGTRISDHTPQSDGNYGMVSLAP